MKASTAEDPKSDAAKAGDKPRKHDQHIRDIGFDPDLVRVVVLTPMTAYAIATDYPEPANPPTEA